MSPNAIDAMSANILIKRIEEGWPWSSVKYPCWFFSLLFI